MKFNPEDHLDFTFDITSVPVFPTPLNKIMRARTDVKALALQKKYKYEILEYQKWLDKAKWYYAFKGNDKGKMPDEYVRSFTTLSHGLAQTTSLLLAFNTIKRYNKKNRKR